MRTCRQYFPLLASTALLLSACSPAAEPVPTDAAIIDAAAVGRMDSTLSRFVESGTVAGVSALVYEKGAEVYFGAYGMADREAGVRMDRGTIVQIFSMTKPITGVALMSLYEDGAFALDDPVARHLPEFADMQVLVGVDTQGKPILEPPRRPMTIRDLTRHTSGLASDPGSELGRRLLSEADPLNPENTLEVMTERFGSLPLWFHPGERWAYGPSVDVQAALVERLSGQPFRAYLRGRVLDPLGMSETRYVVPHTDWNRFAALYQRSDDAPLARAPDETARSFNERSRPLTPGGWGLTSTIDDYMRFARMLLNEGELDGTRVLESETVRLMATNQLADSVSNRLWLPSKGQVGFGIDFAVRIRPPASATENNGVVGEFFWDGAASTLFWVDPANDLAAVLFVQLVPFDGVGLHKAFRDAVYGPVVPIP